MPEIYTKIYPAVGELDEGEILRYAGVRGEADEGIRSLLRSCAAECRDALSYRVCYTEIEELAPFIGNSRSLARALQGASRAVVFAATVGIGIDRLIARYAAVAPSKALFFQAIGAERIEKLCDLFCREMQEGGSVKRFSPGYGDYPLEEQKRLFALLSPERKIGLTLTDGLLMTPTKSVTAVFGI